MTKILLVAFGGSLGAVLRYIFSISLKYSNNFSFISTLFVNLIGSFFIGYFIYHLQNKNFSEDIIKYFFIIGFLGSFTTFSAFSFEVLELLQNNRFSLSIIYVMLSLALCVFAAFLGLNFHKIINWLNLLKLKKKRLI